MPPRLRVAGRRAAVGLALLAATACSPSLSDDARTVEREGAVAATEPYDSAVCELVRQGIDAYNAGDLETSVRAFDDALPLARSRAQQLGDGRGAGEAEDLLAAVTYYAGLGVEQLRQAFPASPETRRFQVTTLSQCQPLPTGLEEPPEDAQET